MGFKEIKIGVLMGGPSAEHEVSLASGKNILAALRKKGYQASPLLLSKKKKLSQGKKKLIFPRDLQAYDIIFNALHGTFGEDGQIQMILEKLGVPYTGSNASASGLGIDKWKTGLLYKKNGLRIPKSQLIQKRGETLRLLLPVVLKPRASGSSDGVSIVRSQQEYKNKVAKLLTRGDQVIVQEYIQGREFTCGVLEKNKKALSLPVVEIRPSKEFIFFDYAAKYTPGASEEIVPAKIPAALAKKIQKMALIAHKTIGCRAYSRSDFLLRDKDLYILETNTLPGMTETSLMPKEAKALGMNFEDLVEDILLASLKA